MMMKAHAFGANMVKGIWLASATLLLGLSSLGVHAQEIIAEGCPDGSTPKQITITAGEKDDFRLPTELATPGAVLSEYSQVWNQFDETKKANPVGHTFKDLPCYIISAQLRISVSAIGRSTGEDFIGLEAQDGKFVWTSQLKALNETWPRSFVIDLDLSRLPTAKGEVDLLKNLADGELDVYLSEGIAVDYMELVLTYCEFTDCNNNCVPDHIDIRNRTSLDVNKNGIPDECETTPGTIKIFCDAYLSVRSGDDCCAWLILSPDVETTGEVGTYTVTNDFNSTVGEIVTACFPLGVTQITFFVTTSTGLSAQCTTVIHVYDNSPPKITPRP